MKKFFVLIASLLIALPVSASEPATESLYSVAFKWKNQRGEEASLSAFKGSPVVLTLAYTKCKTACPMTMQRVKRIAAAVTEEAPDTQFVIVSLDPDNDTPETLAQFQKHYKLEGAGWHLFTGQETEVRKLSVLLGYSYQKQPDDEIAHSNKIVALDSEGRVRAELEGLSSGLEPFIEQVGRLAMR